MGNPAKKRKCYNDVKLWNERPERLSNPEKQDFETMMRAHGPRIYTLAIRLLGPADGPDLAQEVFVSAWKSWERFRGEADPGTWLYRICVNLWKNRVRYEKRRAFWKHFSFDGGAEDERDTARELPSPEAPVGQHVETSDQQGLVQAALAALEPQERAIVVLRDMDDRSYEEIAALLEVPLGTVKSRLARSRERLRHILEAKGIRHG